MNEITCDLSYIFLYPRDYPESINSQASFLTLKYLVNSS